MGPPGRLEPGHEPLAAYPYGLRYLADRPVAEIAAREGVAEATVRSWLHRGRCALAAHLTTEAHHA